MTAVLLAALALAVAVGACYVALAAVHTAQGHGDPLATATPVCDSCVPEEEQPPQPRQLWLPHAGRGE